MTEGKARIAVTGLAVMGSNLARNLARHGFKVAVHNRTPAKMKDLLAEHGHEGDFVGAETLQDLVDSLQTPRQIIIMVKAGGPTDAVIDELSGCSNRATSSSTAATRTTPTRAAARPR